MIDNVSEIKDYIKKKISLILEREPDLKEILYQIFLSGSAYIVGGFLRDAVNKKDCRDIDIIVDVDKEKLLQIVSSSDCTYCINRHGGIKLNLISLDVDIWSIESNWAFEQNLVSLSDDKNSRLLSIAKGCFYNYDSLVMNLANYNFDFHYYKQFQDRQELDILMFSPEYKNLNPTTEANIIRAFFIKEKYEVGLSNQLEEYLFKKISSLGASLEESINRILEVKIKYPKYNKLSNARLVSDIEDLMREFGHRGQIIFN